MTPSLGYPRSGFQPVFPLFLAVPEARSSQFSARNQPPCAGHFITAATCSLTCLLLAVPRLSSLTMWFILPSPPSPTQPQHTQVNDSNLSTHPSRDGLWSHRYLFTPGTCISCVNSAYFIRLSISSIARTDVKNEDALLRASAQHGVWYLGDMNVGLFSSSESNPEY